MTTKQAWYLFYNSPAEISKWEHTEPEYIAKWGQAGGLVLRGCPHCGKYQTHETYVEGFWAEVIELVTDYVCKGISRCQCGGWSHWVS